MLEKEIKARYLKTHDELSEDYYKNKLMSEAEFIEYHWQNWNDLEAELIAEGYRQPHEPEMDYKTEILKLKDEIEKLKVK